MRSPHAPACAPSLPRRAAPRGPGIGALARKGLLLLLMAASLGLLAAPRRQVRVWVFPFLPAIFLDQDGQAKGFYVDMLREVAKREDWELTFQPGTWAEGLERVQSGEVDLLTSVAFTPERSRFLDYGKEASFTVWSLLYAHPKAGIETIQEVQGQRVGLMKNDVNGAHFRELCSQLGITATFLEFDGFPNVLAAVAEGQVEAGVTANTFGYAKESEYRVRRTSVMFNPFALYFATAKGRNQEVLQALDTYLQEGKGNPASGYHHALNHWLHREPAEALPPWIPRAALIALALFLLSVASTLVFRSRVRRATREIRALNEELKKDVAERDQALALVEAANTLLTAVLESSPEVIIFALDRSYRYLAFNRKHQEAMRRLWGREIALGESLLDAIGDHPDRHSAQANLDRALSGASFVQVEEYGDEALSRRYWQDYWAPIRSTDGAVIGLTCYALDVTEHQRSEERIRSLNVELESRVQERTAQLESANRELEAFSYSVSHDLRSPLRGIDGFSKLLLDDYGDRLSDDGRHYLQRIRAGIQRMGKLIGDLLDLSWKNREPIHPRWLDLSALAQGILDELARREPARKVVTHVETGLAASADPGLLGSVLENLLSNAWKFTAKTQDARIAFSQERQPDGTHAFRVSDNGAGFDMAYADRLFGAFQRLHDASDYEGTGIGLAIVQRIIHRHGGRIWAEAEQGKGANFFFTLPERGDS